MEIPVTFASDPRHGFGSNPAASLPAGDFSLWPETLGMAATRDPSLVETFGRYANEEYRAVGIRLALHPMADLKRINLTDTIGCRLRPTGIDLALSTTLDRFEPSAMKLRDRRRNVATTR